MTSICTLLKKGPKYGTKDVNNIFRSLKKHTTKPFKFYCYTDYDTEFLDEDINIIELENDDKKLQWYKLDFFKKGIVKEEDIILMDIDQVIIRNCDFLFDDPEVLVWSNDPSAKVNHMLGTEKNFILTNYSKNS